MSALGMTKPAARIGSTFGRLLRLQTPASSRRLQTRWLSSTNFSDLLSTPEPPPPKRPAWTRTVSNRLDRLDHLPPPPPLVPKPIPFVPDVKTFLTLIGRGLKQHTSKFPSWEALFSLTAEQLAELGIQPARTRRYLLEWRQRFREGKFGPGGDFQYVQDGKAWLGVAKYNVSDVPGGVRWEKKIVNIPEGKRPKDVPRDQHKRVREYTVKGGRSIAGPYALKVNERLAHVTVTEGMWEDKRGRKIDGGERRQAEVRFKRRILERKAKREARGY